MDWLIFILVVFVLCVAASYMVHRWFYSSSRITKFFVDLIPSGVCFLALSVLFVGWFGSSISNPSAYVFAGSASLICAFLPHAAAITEDHGEIIAPIIGIVASIVFTLMLNSVLTNLIAEAWWIFLIGAGIVAYQSHNNAFGWFSTWIMPVIFAALMMLVIIIGGIAIGLIYYMATNPMEAALCLFLLALVSAPAGIVIRVVIE